MTDIQLRQPVTIEIGSSGGQHPTLSAMFFKDRALVCVHNRRFFASGGGKPAEQLGSTTVLRSGFAFVHHRRNARTMFVQDVGPILKEIADHQIEVAIAIEIGLSSRVGVPSAGARADELRHKFYRSEL